MTVTFWYHPSQAALSNHFAATGRTCDPQEICVTGYSEKYAVARIETDELAPEVRSAFAPFVDGDKIRVGLPLASPVVLTDAASLAAFAAGIREQQAAAKAKADREAAEGRAKAEGIVASLEAWAAGGEGERPYVGSNFAPSAEDLAARYRLAKERADARSEREAQEKAFRNVARVTADLVAYGEGAGSPTPQKDWLYSVRGDLRRVSPEASAALDAALLAAAARDERDAAAEEEARTAAEAEKRAWVQAHGSDHLRRAVAAGYDCQRKYVVERAALEFPGFVADFDRRADWKRRACPSEGALALVEILNHLHQDEGDPQAEVVWLTSGTEEVEEDPYDDAPGFAACEAVVVTGFLGRYTLVRIV